MRILSSQNYHKHPFSKEACSKGGLRSHELHPTLGSENGKKVHKLYPNLSKESGHKGGLKTASIPGHMSKIGKIGGKIGGKRVHELHPEQQKESSKKAAETKRRLIKEGLLNPYESKE